MERLLKNDSYHIKIYLIFIFNILLNRIVKLFIQIILNLFLISTKYNKYDFEKHLIRYLKFNKKQIK